MKSQNQAWPQIYEDMCDYDMFYKKVKRKQAIISSALLFK